MVPEAIDATKTIVTLEPAATENTPHEGTVLPTVGLAVVPRLEPAPSVTCVVDRYVKPDGSVSVKETFAKADVAEFVAVIE